MKIKCPRCNCENYFTGLEEGTKFCSSCNRPLPEPKIPNATESTYIKIRKEKPDTSFLGSKKMLDKEAFSDLLVDWVVESLKIGRKKGFFQRFLKDIEKFGIDKVTEDKFYEEIIYFYMWMAYINCADTFQNKNKINDYFYRFTRKIYGLFSMFSKLEYGGYKEEEWIEILTKKLNDYLDAYTLFLKGDSIFNKSALGREFYKNLYGKESLGFITNYIFTTFITEELKFSFRTLLKGLMRFKI